MTARRQAAEGPPVAPKKAPSRRQAAQKAEPDAKPEPTVQSTDPGRKLTCNIVQVDDTGRLFSYLAGQTPTVEHRKFIGDHCYA